jgi:hypothetical protein
MSFPLGSVKHNLPTPMRHDLVRGGRLKRAGITPRVHSGPSPAFPLRPENTGFSQFRVPNPLLLASLIKERRVSTNFLIAGLKQPVREARMDSLMTHLSFSGFSFKSDNLHLNRIATAPAFALRFNCEGSTPSPSETGHLAS